MVNVHRTARGWLILLAVLLLAFVAAVVWVVVGRAQVGDGANGGDGATSTTVSQEADREEDAASGEGEAASEGEAWFTAEQASRGEEAYAEACASCHGAQLEGGAGPALTGEVFWDRWGGETVHTLFEVTRQTMPQGAPGSLDLETYVDLTAHVLSVNGFPSGDDALSSDEALLTDLPIEEAPREGAPEDATDGEGEDAAASEADGAEDGDAPEGTADGRSAPAEEGGWFAEAQVRSGSAIYAEHCARCHGNDLQGDPPLVGGGFPERYETVWGLYQYVQQTMPLDRPGSLRDAAYLDTVAYLLDANGYPQGDRHRDPSRAVLLQMPLDAERAESATSEPGTPEDDGAGNGEAATEDQDGDGDAPSEGGEAADEERDGEGDGAEDGDANDGATASEEPASDEGADANGSDEAGSTAGRFDRAQADRGGEPYAQHCAQCHGDDLQGEPPLTGEAFLGSYESVWDLFAYTRDNMPLTDPGSLDDEVYADVVAYVLAENDLPDGGPEFGPDQEDAMRDLPLDPDAGDGGAQDDGEAEAEPDANGEGETSEASDAEGADGDPEAADGEGGEGDDADRDDGATPALASLEIDARPANLTINLLGPDGFARRAMGAQTLVDLQPGRYVVAGSRGHESTTVNVVVAAGETARVRLVLDELARSTDVPEEPAMPATEIPAILRDPGEGVLVGEAPAAALGAARTGGSAAPPSDGDFAADRGRHAFALHCARCHGDDLEGNVAPALGGDVFFERWGGHPVDWLYFQARAAMPPHGAGSLREQTYADIVVYLLTANGVLEGFESFAPGDEAFRMLVIERRQGDDGLPALEDQVESLRETLHGAQDEGEPIGAGPLPPVEWPDDLGIAPIGNEGDWLGPIDRADEPPGEDPVDEPDDEADDDEGSAGGTDRPAGAARPVATPRRAA